MGLKWLQDQAGSKEPHTTTKNLQKELSVTVGLIIKLHVKEVVCILIHGTLQLFLKSYYAQEIQFTYSLSSPRDRDTCLKKLQMAEASKLKNMRRVEKRLTDMELDILKLSVEIWKGETSSHPKCHLPGQLKRTRVETRSPETFKIIL